MQFQAVEGVHGRQIERIPVEVFDLIALQYDLAQILLIELHKNTPTKKFYFCN